MAWTTIPTAVTGQTWSANDENTFVKDNLNELFPAQLYSFSYSDSTNTLAETTYRGRYAVLFRSSTGAGIGPLGVVTARSNYSTLGGSSAWWYYSTSTSGSTGFTGAFPTGGFIQCGNFYSNGLGATITFPRAFSAPPFVYLSVLGGSTTNPWIDIRSTANITSSNFACDIGSTSNLFVSWLAIGDS
jgi:hypothetical protein